MTIQHISEVLEQLSCGGIGAEGPTLEELDEFVETNQKPYGDDQDYHTVQYAWRLLEKLRRDIYAEFYSDYADKEAVAKMLEVIG